MNHIGQIALLVSDYDEAIDYYTQVLGFELIEDSVLSSSKRWVVIAPKGSNHQGCNLLLAKASNEVQETYIGNQTGGRVFLFLYTSDFQEYHRNLIQKSVEIVNGPRIESYGKVLVFRDLYGNLWDLIQTN